MRLLLMPWAGLTVVLLLAAGCATSSIKEINDSPALRAAARTPVIDGHYKLIQHRQGGTLKENYAPEIAYIRTRRDAAKLDAAPADGMPTNLVGLCFSGGGIRSATFNLGVLQAFNDAQKLKDVDYLSCVSGGAYIGAWYVSHLLPATPGAQRFPPPLEACGGAPRLSSENGVVAYAHDPAQLLATRLSDSTGLSGETGTPSAALQLQGDSGFILKDPGGWGSLRLITSYAWRWPFHIVFDLGLHFKPTRGKFNWYHPVDIYRRQLEQVYLSMANGQTEHTQLHEINPAGSVAPYLIINASQAQGWFPGPDVNHPFEMTRDYCGSPAIGYLPTPLFDKPVESVLWDTNRPAYVKLAAGPIPLTKSRPFRVSHAIAASGAAADAAGLEYHWYNSFINLGLTLFNANLRYQTRNFGQKFAETAWFPVDRLREITLDRFHHGSTANTLYLSDGNHVENYGIVALAQRHVRTIYIFDVGMDPQYSYSSIERARSRIERTPCQACGTDFTWDIRPLPGFGYGTQPNAPIKSYSRSRLSCPQCAYTADVYFVKASFDQRYANPPEFLRAYAAHDASFPHTTTAIQWYDFDRFEAYRQLGHWLTTTMLTAPRDDTASNP